MIGCSTEFSHFADDRFTNMLRCFMNTCCQFANKFTSRFANTLLSCFENHNNANKHLDT